MIPVSDATAIILSNLFSPSVREVSLEESIGAILAEQIMADRDLPPFNRVAMDGIAIAFTAVKSGQRSFRLAGIQAAGQSPLTLSTTSNGIEVMTGAMLPVGCDTVIPYENLSINKGEALILDEAIEPNQHIHEQGRDAKKSEPLLSIGTKISPAEIAVLASVGKSSVHIYATPQIAIISTGDELVDTHSTPLAWQIRRSNTYAIQAALKSMQLQSTLFHITDNQEDLKKELTTIFSSHEIIILSGGVSKGKFDFVPTVLEELGIHKLFHQVSQKPGKPFWFGKGKKQTVFALPGNPVSTYACFYRYIKPWLEKSMGTHTVPSKAILAHTFHFKPNLTLFLQVRVQNEAGKLMAYPAPGGGSGDFVNLKEVTGFLELPAEQQVFEADDSFDYISFR